MSIVRMKKLQVVGLDADREKLLPKLMDLGAVQITGRQKDDADSLRSILAEAGGGGRVQALDQKISEMDDAIGILEHYSPVRSPLFFTRRALRREAFEGVKERESTVAAFARQVRDLNDEVHQLSEKRNRSYAELTALEPWKPLGIPLEQTETKTCDIGYGILPIAADMEEIRQQMNAICPEWSLEEVAADKDFRYLLLISRKPETEALREVLKQHAWAEAQLRGMTGTVAENEARIREEAAETESRIQSLEEEITGRYSQKPEIECLRDYYAIQRDREAIQSDFRKTKRTFVFEGWLPEKAEKRVGKCLEDCGCWYRMRDPEPDEEVPVLIRNNGFVTPFESVTEMYALPDYRGIDPTKFFSAFYVIFFGIMLSDAGYGIVLTAATWFLLKRYDLEGTMYKLIRMLFYCGISTICWGAVFGGWFGNAIQVISSTFFGKEVAIPPIWYDPITDPTKLLLFSLALGVIHLFVGMGLHAYMCFRDKHPLDAICDDFSWYMVIIGALVWFLGRSHQPLGTIGLVLVIAGALILLLMGGRGRKGIGRVIGGFSSLYNVTSYLSDILSYARLLALGLATGVIAQVINTIGSLFGGGVKGALILAVVFVIGHLFNLAINALGAFVHTSRLQYIEFFGKFYVDGGEPFDPFRKKTKYIRVVDDSMEVAKND